ncbi:DNA polymerase III subunit beta [Kitasatospora sp. NBC_00315]|uniref:DNA polymerase III subunit beta n=1 Tax=Kitasatospora sp. NBC_00315 TaxID=2975963 RepID=UPI00324F73C0
MTVLEDTVKLRLFAGPFADAVAHVARALPTRPPVPVLAGILLRTDEHGLHLAAFDYEACATTRIDAEIADDGTALVSGRLLNDICKALPKAAEVDIELSGARLLLTAGTARFTLPTLPVEEYPALPAAPDTVLTVDGDALADAVTQTVVAAGTDDTLPALTGVQMILEGSRLTLAATDRYRFAVRELTVKPTGTLPDAKPVKKTRKKGEDAGPTAEELDAAARTVLVPAKFLAEAARALAGEHPVAIGWSDGQLTLSIPGRTTGTRLLEAEFPKFRGLFPDTADAELTITVPVEETLAAIKRVALVASDKSPLRLAVDGDQLLIEAGDGDDARAVDRVPCAAVGAIGDRVRGCDVAFKPGYLADCLKALATPEARLHLTSSTKPVLVLGYSGDLAEGGYQHLLMPIRLQG